MDVNQAQQLQDVWDWCAALTDPAGNPPNRSRFNWPALLIADRFSKIDAALSALASAVAAIPALPADVVDDLHTIATDLRKLTG